GSRRGGLVCHPRLDPRRSRPLMDLEFAHPEFLYLVLLLPVWWLAVWPRAGGGVLFARGDSARRRARRTGASAGFVLTLPRLLRAAVLFCLILAVWEPRRPEFKREISLPGKGIGLVVDLSSSVLAEGLDGGD